MHQETESKGLVFQHFSYVTSKQLQFKEQYYGYQNAVSQWEKLQQQTKFPVLLSEYFAWVRDKTQVETADKLGVVPIAQKENNTWQFIRSITITNQIPNIQSSTAEILQIELDLVRRELQEAQLKIASMESTKFWKLRDRWFRFKKMFEFELDNNSIEREYTPIFNKIPTKKR